MNHQSRPYVESVPAAREPMVQADRHHFPHRLLRLLEPDNGICTTHYFARTAPVLR
ncbi:MAG: hypothetical protein K0R28_4180 [Paenibacillus sp.]|nr:hypothetical protein [Paenibacillus sp.]